MSGQQTVAQHPVVLRFAEMFPDALPQFEMHRRRTGGDLSHVDRARSSGNRRLIGGEDWARDALAEIDAMRAENFAEELEALKARKRKKEIAQRLLEGPKDPWRNSKGGPLREVILTAHRDYFTVLDADGALDAQATAAQERAFEARAVEWLTARFGADVVHARGDVDETAYHIHAVIMPRHEKTSKTSGRQRLLQPSVHPLIKDYEAAQDDVGVFFAPLGLRRGDRSAEARRAVTETRKERAAQPDLATRSARERRARLDAEAPLPERRQHIPPGRWRDDYAVRIEKAGDALTGAAAVAVAATEVAATAADAAAAALAQARDDQAAANARASAAAKREQRAAEVAAQAEADREKAHRIKRAAEATAEKVLSRAAAAEDKAIELRADAQRDAEAAADALAVAAAAAEGGIDFDSETNEPICKDPALRERLRGVMHAETATGRRRPATVLLNRLRGLYRAFAARRMALDERLAAADEALNTLDEWRSRLSLAVPGPILWRIKELDGIRDKAVSLIERARRPIPKSQGDDDR